MPVFAILILLSLAFSSELASEVDLTIIDCGDKTYLLHYTNVTASKLIRGKEATIQSEKELLSADITSGDVVFTVNRNDKQIFTHDLNYCGYQEISLPLFLGKIKYTGSDCSQPRPMMDSFSAVVKLPLITPSGKYEFKLDGKATSGQKLFCFYAYATI